MYNLDDPVKAIGMMLAVIASLGVVIAGVSIMIDLLTKRIKDIERVGTNVNSVYGGIRLLIQQVSTLITAISWFMLSFAAAANALALIPEDKQDYVLTMMAIQAGLIGAILLGLGFIIHHLSKQIIKMGDPAKSGQLTASLHHVGAMLAAVMTSMSWLIATTVGAVALISIIPRS